MAPDIRQSQYPKLIAFDLDYTLWDLWIDTHVEGPLRRVDNRVNEVLDRDSVPISFYRDVPAILHAIRATQLGGEVGEKVVISACSRTHAPALAHQCLNLLLVASETSGDAVEASDEGGEKDEYNEERDDDHGGVLKVGGRGPIPAINFFDELEIYPGSKLTHFKKLHQKTRIAYSDMLFFDDERRNKEVEKLGVTFHHVPSGLTQQAFNEGLASWMKKTRA